MSQESPTYGDVEEGEKKVALVGCPNVGKSVVFNELADTYVDVSNYPGTTLETTLARFNGYLLTDTPGVHGLSSFNEEERTARDIVLESDIVVNVVDATQLERDMFLTLQLLDMGTRMVVALNMMDEADSEGKSVDSELLEERLGVPVVPTVATDGEGIEDLEAALEKAAAREDPPITDWFKELPSGIKGDLARKTLLVESDDDTIDDLPESSDREEIRSEERREKVYSERRERVNSLADEVVSSKEGGGGLAETLGDLMITPLTGTPIAIGILGLIYFLIGDLVAQRLVDFLELRVFEGIYIPIARDLIGAIIPAEGAAGALHFILVNGNLGLLTVTVQYLFGVLLPLVVSFYLALGLLEDSGVLPRIAVLTDRGLSRIGLNGRAVIPMIVGVGCVTMAILTTRMMGSRRERIIATALLGLAIPCSAQLGIIMGMLAGLGIMWWFAYVGVLVLVLGLAGTVLDRVLPGEARGLVTELPRLRVPQISNIFHKTVNRTRMFLREAIPLFAAASLVVSVLDLTGLLESLESLLNPVTTGIGMPAEFSQVLLLGVIRRDFAAAGMTDLVLSPEQVFVGLVVITLFVPCILSIGIILKERDAKSGLLIWAGSWTVAFTVGWILSQVLI